jgi:hypothetical protein
MKYEAFYSCNSRQLAEETKCIEKADRTLVMRTIATFGAMGFTQEI